MATGGEKKKKKKRKVVGFREVGSMVVLGGKMDIFVSSKYMSLSLTWMI